MTVTKYIACDDQEFMSRSECEAHEREVRNILEHGVLELMSERLRLRYAINEARLNARIACIDAQNLKSEARSAMSKSKYHTKMSEYWLRTAEYNAKRRELREVRLKLSMQIDSLYMWFGLHKKKSSVARLERKRRSMHWRQENTPDKWRTPNKIRVNKLPKEEQQ